MLTTKVKKDFTKWYGNLKFKSHDFEDSPGWNKIAYNEFINNRSLAEQFGVYQDYFNVQHDLFIETGHGMTINNVLYFYAEIFKRSPVEDDIPLKSLFEKNFKTPDEARKKAIQEASKLLEGRL